MKNKRIERLKTAAKQFHRSEHGYHFKNGIVAIHDDDELEPQRLSWREDVMFILNDYQVYVSWFHPRAAYVKQFQKEVRLKMKHFPCPDWLGPSKALYKKLGRSRVKIMGWRTTPVNWSAWAAEERKVRAQVELDANHVIVPSMESYWSEYGRSVMLCMPMEIHNEQDRITLAAITKRLLTRQVSLKDLFPDYRYTRDDWAMEREQMTPDP